MTGVLRRAASALLEALLETAAPTRCAGCELPGALLCDECRASLPRIDAALACRRCAAPRSHAGERCRECDGRAFAFAGARAFGSLAHPLSRLVTMHKDGGEERLAPVFASLLAETAADWIPWADAIVPVPASSQAIRRRGRDHMLDVALSLGADCGRPAEPLLLRGAGADQRRLGRDERSRNLLGAMRAAPGHGVLPGRVLLVDDVLTTGATAHAAAEALHAEGVHDVRCAVVARAHRVA